MHKKLINISLLCLALSLGATSCSKKYDASSLDLPYPNDDLTEVVYSPEGTQFRLWAPIADAVKVNIYNNGVDGDAIQTIELKKNKADGTWIGTISDDIKGKFYTFATEYDGEWQKETPGIFAKAVGVNGQRGAIIDMDDTNPAGWSEDRAPELKSASDIILYEMHHRDFSMSPNSGISNKGKFLALTEEGAKTPDEQSTGLDHLKELGITHVHLLPSFDYASVNESELLTPQYNWGYDPLNYNVPEGSYATDPFNPTTRIFEFKRMVQMLHRAGIRVVLDVVYNHTFDLENSNFNRTFPGYFYRKNAEGQFSNASGCGNETASDKPMMRKYMIESVKYWMKEYHIDGFRFDLMAIHDIETMNEISQAAHAIDSTVYIYGEGWAASEPQLNHDDAAFKANMTKLPTIAAFSDDIRDALRGPFSDDSKPGFISGAPDMEESIRFGYVGCIQHPDVDMTKVNYSKEPWALEPTQMISYVSCHDDMCLVDRLKASVPSITNDELIRLDKLAQTVVFTSQGVPFMQAGEEVLRDKKMVHNSFSSPDSVNIIDWTRKGANDTFEYYKDLIAMRKNHPAFHMGSAALVRENVRVIPTEGSNLLAFSIKGQAAGDAWSNIVVVFNARKEAATVQLPEAGNYTIVCQNGKINEQGLGTAKGNSVKVPAQSALIMHQ